MRKVKKVFAALLLLFVANALMAQSETYTLKGNLKDANDGAMMPYTNCVLLHLAASEGNVTDELVNAYEELAEGGTAVIVTGLTSILKKDAEIDRGVKFYNDAFIEGHRRLTEAIHKHNAMVMMQTALVDGHVDELSTGQVENIVRAFGDAAHRAEQAGYDGVQIHAAHFFYLSKFISPLINHRTDRFGGNQQRRTQIL